MAVTAHILTPLARPAIARLWSALAFSALGDQLYVVALGFVAVEMLGPAAGYIGAARPAVILVAALAGGRLFDTWSQRRSMVGADLARALVLALLVGVWIAIGAPSVALLAVAVAVLAVGEAVFEPALQAVLPALVTDPHERVAVNGLFDATDRLARLLGPGLVALAGTLIPTQHFFTLDAASFVVSALAVASLRGIAPDVAAPAAKSPREGSYRRGAAALRRVPLLNYALDIKGITNGVWYAVFFLIVPLAISQGGAITGGAALSAYGLVIAGYGLSNLAANLVVGSVGLPERPGPRVIAGIAATGAGIALMAVVLAAPLPSGWRLPALAAAACVSGAGGPLQDITLATLRQSLVPAPDVAAATRVQLIANCVGTLIAMLAAPAIIGWAGSTAAMALCGLVYLGCAVVGAMRPAVRQTLVG